MKAKIHVTLRQGVLDPQGKAIANALHALGFSDVQEVRQGKFIEVRLANGIDRASAQREVEAMCAKLLANPVIEDYAIEFES